jgi:hypothetical protein
MSALQGLGGLRPHFGGAHRQDGNGWERPRHPKPSSPNLLVGPPPAPLVAGRLMSPRRFTRPASAPMHTDNRARRVHLPALRSGVPIWSSTARRNDRASAPFAVQTRNSQNVGPPSLLRWRADFAFNGPRFVAQEQAGQERVRLVSPGHALNRVGRRRGLPLVVEPAADRPKPAMKRPYFRSSSDRSHRVPRSR